MRNFLRYGLLGLVASCAVAGPLGCSDAAEPHRSGDIAPQAGMVGLAVQVAPGVLLDSVHYVVAGGGSSVAGDIPVAEAGSTISVQVGLPAGSGYSVQLTGVATNGTTHCIGAGSFTVAAGVTTLVHVKMQCDGTHVLGAARVDGTLNVCPRVDAYTVAPLQVDVGSDITVTSIGSDVDPGTTLHYAWTATAGSFAAPASSNTTYHCSAPGTQTLTITVADGPDTTDPATMPCKDHADIQVSCITIECGNGMLGPGKTCDHGAANGTPSDTCSAVCTLKCGNGTVETAAGETCEPPGVGSCNGACHTVPATGCGDGIVDPGEQCDHGVANGTASDTCDATCREKCGNGALDPGETCDPTAPGSPPCTASCLQAALLCGNGVVDPGETCDPVRIDVCDASCHTAPCRACELANPTCAARVTECESATGYAPAGPAAGQPRAALCEAVLDCVRQNNCTNGGLNPEYCYCGLGVGITACLNGMVNGPCKTEIERGAESTVPTEVGARYVDPGYATGLAFRVIQCDAQSCAAPTNGCFAPTACGDGVANFGESCDHGSANNGQPADTCSAVCTFKCGNGAVDAAVGETCEPPGTISCDGQCHVIVGCGNGVVDAAVGETCEPPGTLSCDGQCHAIVGCGNGMVEAGEQCDHGTANGTVGNSCDAQCRNTCGNGMIDPGEYCDPAASPTGAPAGFPCPASCTALECGDGVVSPGETCDPPRIDVCTATCQLDSCRACELADPVCAPKVSACENAPGTAAAGPAAGQPKAVLCKAVLDCVRTKDCTNGGLDPEYCYCGAGVDISACLSGTPTGVCKTEIERGAESTVAADIGTRFSDPAYATGLAMGLLSCDRTHCASSGCFN